jgi:uncharacterized protein DUF2188
MALEQYRLAKHSDQWRLEKAGSQRAIFAATTKAEAMRRMRTYMTTHGGSVSICKTNGQVQEQRTYGRHAQKLIR